MMSLPRVFDWSSCPLRKPSPAATMRTTETIPQAIPNMVRNVRSLCDHRVRKTSLMRSRRTMTQGWTLTRVESKPGGGVAKWGYGIRRGFVQRNTNAKRREIPPADASGDAVLRQSPMRPEAVLFLAWESCDEG